MIFMSLEAAHICHVSFPIMINNQIVAMKTSAWQQCLFYLMQGSEELSGNRH